MSKLTDNETDFLNKHFKAGEYVSLTLLVKTSDLNRLIEHLKESGLNLAILPRAQQTLDFETNDDNKGNVQ